MSPYIPALNEIRRRAFDETPKYPENANERHYLILFPEDYDGHGVDVEGNVALLVDKEQAKEVRDLAAKIVTELSDNEAPIPDFEDQEFEYEKLVSELEALADKWEDYGDAPDEACARELRDVLEDYTE